MYYGLSVQDSNENLAPAFGGDKNSGLEIRHYRCSIGAGEEVCIMVGRCKIRTKILLLPSAGMKILLSRCFTIGALYRDRRGGMYYGLSVQNSSGNIIPAFGGDEISAFEMPHNRCSL